MKNLIIATIIGLVFMAGGFWYGMKLMPVPPPAKEVAANAPAAAPAAPAISIDTLKKTSETMMALNDALQVREQNVADRERRVREREDELNAEREALDRSHEKFKALFNEFQDRLQLVEASQLEQLQKQADLYIAMGSDQSIELIRAMDDASMTRLFSVMDTKPLSKLVAQWKAKYPDDTQRLLHALDGMAQVLPKDKIALSDPPPDASATTSAPAATTPATDPTTAPAPETTPAPATEPNATPPTPPAAPAPDPTSEPAAPATPTPAPGLTPPPDSNSAPVSTATTN
jgi:hypothetical protein